MADGEESSDYYNKEEGAYCYTGDRRPNHDVVIIGWDEIILRKISVQPEGDGAFICANSWGGVRRAGIFLRILIMIPTLEFIYCIQPRRFL